MCQTAIFDPAGIAGIAYWYALYPVHRLVFGGMLRGIERAIKAADAGAGPGSQRSVTRTVA